MSRPNKGLLKACLLGAALGLTGCRTTLRPASGQASPEEYRGERSCQVQPFESAAELPTGAKNLGWVTVSPQEGGDEATQAALADKICELGGDAYTHPAWVHEPGTDTPQLRANAWLLPAKGANDIGTTTREP